MVRSYSVLGLNCELELETEAGNTNYNDTMAEGSDLNHVRSDLIQVIIGIEKLSMAIKGLEINTGTEPDWPDLIQVRT